MKLSTYLNFNGCCEAAFNFYADHLGARITHVMTFRDGPPEAAESVPEQRRDKVMHAHLTIDGHELMGTDGVCGDGSNAGDAIKNAHVVLYVDEPAEAERIYGVLSEQGNVEMPMNTTFFARRFGMVVDRFGVPWMVMCE